jgi:hypothetical protein
VDGQHGRRRPGARHHARPAVHALELVCLPRDSRAPRHEPGRPPRPSASPPGGAAPNTGLGDHGHARQGRSAAATSARSGDLSDPPLLGHAAGIGGHSPRPKLGSPVGLAKRTREGRQDPRHSPADRGRRHQARHADLLVHLRSAVPGPGEATDGRQERGGSAKPTDA